MKTFVIFLFLVFSTGLTYAQIAKDEKETQFELEEDTVQIRDLEAERKTAQDEAAAQEKEEREMKKQLQKLESQKNHEAQVTQKVLALYRDRVHTAEKNQKNYTTQTNILNKEIAKLKNQVTMGEARAKSSEVAVNDAIKMLGEKKKEKLDLAKREAKAGRDTANFENQLRVMRIQYARLKMETQQLEGHLKMIEDIEAKKEAEKEEMTRSIASVKERRKAADDAVRAHQGTN